jgi:Glycosyltransferases involved in cell wall biogenesis
MKISAVIPAYNSAKFISAAVDSIHAQTTPIDEIIIIDDGSTDNTEQIVATLPGNIIYHKQVNQGPSAARNKGIEIASGDWIAFLDADDQWTAEKISRQLQTLATNPSLHLIAGDMAEIDNQDQTIVPSVLAKHDLLDSFMALNGQPIPNALSNLIKKNFIPTGTVLVKRTTLIEAGLFNVGIRFGEDLELWAKIAAFHPITCLPEVLMLRRQHGANATQASEAMLIDLPRVMESLRKQTSAQLQQQGINPNAMVAGSYWNLGYWYFAAGDLPNAQKAFHQSLRQHWSLRSALYFAASLLPNSIIETIRTTKQKFSWR